MQLQRVQEEVISIYFCNEPIETFSPRSVRVSVYSPRLLEWQS